MIPGGTASVLILGVLPPGVRTQYHSYTKFQKTTGDKSDETWNSVRAEEMGVLQTKKRTNFCNGFHSKKKDNTIASILLWGPGPPIYSVGAYSASATPVHSIRKFLAVIRPIYKRIAIFIFSHQQINVCWLICLFNRYFLAIPIETPL